MITETIEQESITDQLTDEQIEQLFWEEEEKQREYWQLIADEYID